MYRIALAVLVVSMIGVSEVNGRYRIPDAHISVPSLIRRAGYPAQKHYAVTADGYILQLYRIPAGRRPQFGDDGKRKKAVLIVHGMFGCSSNFVIMGPDKSLGYILADAGYDVWLANLRGNLNTAHKNLTRDNPKFWEYSFHEHGLYDVPALIDKVLRVTGEPKLLFIGHSMGVTSFFTAMSLRPDYNDKVLASIALAPPVYINNMKPLAEVMIKSMNIISMMRSHGIMSANLRPELLDFFVSNLCSVKRNQDNVCVQLLQAVDGEDFEQTDPELVMRLFGRAQPASWRQLEHFGKIAMTGKLEHFGKIAMTGVFTSWEDGIYGAVKPYNISNVRVPVLILYGENDRLVQKSQVMRLAKDLADNGVLEEVLPGCTWPKFNHFDFIIARDLASLLNRPLVKHINRLFEKYSTLREEHNETKDL